MQLLIRTPSKRYFIAVFSAMAALFVLFSLTIYHYQRQSEDLNSWTLYNYEAARQSRRILFDLIDMETGTRGYLLTGQKKFLMPYEKARSKLNEHIAQLWTFTKGDSKTHDDIDLWLVKIEKYSAGLDAQVRARALQGKESITVAGLEKQKHEMDSLRELLEANVQARLKKLQDQIDASGEKREDFKSILLIGTVLTIGALALAIGVVLSLLQRSELAEKKASVVEERFLTVMHGIDDGLYDFVIKDGKALNSVYFSPSYKSMLGYTDEEYPNTIEMSMSVLHPDEAEGIMDHFKRYLAGEIPQYHAVLRMRHKDGHWIWVLSRGVGLRDAKGNIVRFIGTHTDITEQKNREEELKQLNDEMETFSYITSHDLRSPLVNLKGFAGEMERGLTLTKPIIDKVAAQLDPQERTIWTQVFEEEMPESLHFIKQAVSRMDALTTAVLNLSSIGKRVYRFVPVDTQEVVGRCLDALSYELNQKRIEVTCATLPTIICDALAIEQIFSNILDNAVKYSDPAKPGAITIAAQVDGSQVTFSIRDTGRGIQEADREKVFQIFRRARNTEDIRGLGIGMTFVQATLRRLGGTIWFESTPGVGTVFHFRLPTRLFSRLDLPVAKTLQE